MAGEQDFPRNLTLVDASDLTAIANAIRNKRGTSNTIAVSSMASSINAINTTIGSISGYSASYTNSGINTLVNGKLDATTHSRFYNIPLNQILSLTVLNYSDVKNSIAPPATTFTARDIQYALTHDYPVIMGTSVNSSNGFISNYWKTTTAVALAVPILVFDSNNADITKTSLLGDACIFQGGSSTGVERTDAYPYSNYIISCRLLIEYSNKPLW